MESILIQLFFSAFGSKQKKTNIMAPSYHPKVSSIQNQGGILIFLLFWSWSLALYFHVWVK